MLEKGELRRVKHRTRSSEDLEKGDRLEGVGRGRGYRGSWCPPREGLDRDAGG